ncbi:MAG TPA: EamA/RhaT family transporter [Bacteroidetes bacterium]|nr:EamA/RhaT family transporter [Bacteroidota bacterium]
MAKKHASFIPLLKAFFAVVVWGASFIATKIALHDVSPMTVVWLRFGIGVALLGAFVAARKEFAFVSLKELGYFSLLGFLGITFHQWLQSTGLQTSKATTTAWIVATIPIFIALLGWFILRERLGVLGVVGILLAAFGVLLVVSQGDLGALTRGRFGVIGDVLVLISAPNWAVFSVVSRRGLKKHPPTRMMFYVMITGWLFTSVWFTAGSGYNEVSRLTTDGWIGILFLGVFCSGLAYIYWYDALKEIPASKVGSLLYLEPLVAVVVASVFLHEALFLAAFVGGALILAGVWLVNRPNITDAPPD